MHTNPILIRPNEVPVILVRLLPARTLRQRFVDAVGEQRLELDLRPLFLGLFILPPHPRDASSALK